MTFSQQPPKGGWTPEALAKNSLAVSRFKLGGARVSNASARAANGVDTQLGFTSASLPAIAAQEVIDLTGKTTWDAPVGAWTLLRIGHTTTGKRRRSRKQPWPAQPRPRVPSRIGPFPTKRVINPHPFRVSQRRLASDSNWANSKKGRSSARTARLAKTTNTVSKEEWSSSSTGHITCSPRKIPVIPRMVRFGHSWNAPPQNPGSACTKRQTKCTQRHRHEAWKRLESDR